MSEQENPKPCILFVDDEKPILKALARFSRGKPWNYKVASSGAEGIAVLESNANIDVVVSDMRMPNMSGADFLIHVKENYPRAIRILLTGYSDMDALESAINKARIYNYLTKPWDEYLFNEVLTGALCFQATERERRRLDDLTRKQNRQLGALALSLDKQVKERTIEIEQAMTLLQMTHDRVKNNFFETLTILSQILEWKEGNDSGHSRFVEKYTGKMLDALDLPQEQKEEIGIAARLHRLGIIALPDELRSRPFYVLNKEEKALFTQHPIWAEMALSTAEGLSGSAKIIRHQLEYINGTGTPDALAVNDIPIGSQIIGLLGAFYDAYNGQLEKNISGLEQAKVYISEWAGKRYDTQLIETMFTCIADFNDSNNTVAVYSSGELEADMLLDEDVETKSGLVLLTRGTCLSGNAIKRLCDYEEKFGEKFKVSVVCTSENDDAAQKTNDIG